MTLHPEVAVGRSVQRIVRGVATSDGAGVALTRIIGQPALPDLDPFLLLDEFGSDRPSDYLAGFPEHPHRGFETVTYMLAGRMRHGDNQGNSGLLVAGGLQWMTAGRGIVHSEMPEQEEGLMRGFQLWVNLPANRKMTQPNYQDVAPERIPQVERDGVRVRVLAGAFDDVTGPVQAPDTQPIYLDAALDAGATFTSPLPEHHAAFVYVFEGAMEVGEPARRVERGELAVLTDGTHVRLNAPERAARAIVVAGRPLREPVARYGPIVMNTDQEVRQAFDDLRRGRFVPEPA